MSSSYFELDDAELARYVSWNGPVGADLDRRTDTLRFRAILSTGMKTGDLRRELKSTRETRAEGIATKTGSSVWYSLLHHTGTRPHVIRPRAPGKALRFRVGTTVRYASSVQHPGTKPNPYLTRWLKEAVS